MKFLFIMTLAMLLPFKLATSAGADPTPTAPTLLPEQNLPEPAQSEPVQAGAIAPLSIQQNSGSMLGTDRANQLTNQANQINSNLESQQNRSPRLRDLLNLPDGMIIRGSSRGGIGLGTEY